MTLNTDERNTCLRCALVNNTQTDFKLCFLSYRETNRVFGYLKSGDGLRSGVYRMCSEI